MSFIRLIAAVSKNGIIGIGGKIPWHLPDDMKRFKEATKDDVVIMGRKTWESLPSKFRPLPGRINIVVSTTLPDQNEADTFHTCRTLEHAIGTADSLYPDRGIWIIGGQTLYEQGLELARGLMITHVDVEIEGDATFPLEAMYESFNMLYESLPASHDGVAYTYASYARKLDDR